jgi:hypothetical protein
VSGTASSGGTVPFTTAFASQTPAGTLSITLGTGTLTADATTLSTPQIPSHTHGAYAPGGSGIQLYQTNEFAATTSAATGGGGSHVHSVSGAPSVSSATFTGTAIDLAVQYVDVIIATKD